MKAYCYPAISPDYKCLSFLWTVVFLSYSLLVILYCNSELISFEFKNMVSKSSIEKPQDEMLEEKVAEVRKAPGMTELSPEDAATTRRILLKLDFRYCISIGSACYFYLNSY